MKRKLSVVTISKEEQKNTKAGYIYGYGLCNCRCGEEQGISGISSCNDFRFVADTSIQVCEEIGIEPIEMAKKIADFQRSE